MESTAQVAATQQRLAHEGLATATEDEVACCYALQDRLLLTAHVDHDLVRRASAEAAGTALLVAIVIGSGIYAQRLSPTDVGLQLLENSIATGARLVALILAFGSVSGAHFNPVVTLAERLLGGNTTRDSVAYISAQVAGACVGAVVANLMFDRTLTNTFAGIRPSSAPMFIGMQLLGGLIAIAAARYWYPQRAASELVVPHEHAAVA